MSRVINFITKETTTKMYNVDVPDNVSDEDINEHILGYLKDNKNSWMYSVDINPVDLLSKYGEVQQLESTITDGFSITLSEENEMENGNFYLETLGNITYPDNDEDGDDYNQIETSGIFLIDWDLLED